MLPSYPYRSPILLTCIVLLLAQAGRTQTELPASKPPVIIQYVQENKAGSVLYDSLHEGTLLTQPGKPLAVYFSDSLGSGVLIEYRLHDVSAEELEKEWLRTGPVLSLPAMAAGTTYVLEARYPRSTKKGIWRISVRQHWYQSLPAQVGMYFLAGLLVMFIPWPFYRFVLRREIKKRLLLEDRLKTVQLQLNPHFIYNAISSIGSLISTRQNERANEYLSAFSDIMRETLKNQDRQLVNLDQDIRALEKYIRLEQLRFGFRYRIDTDPELDLLSLRFPPMLLQPIIENAVKYALSHRGEQGILSVSFRKSGAHLTVTVQDNGSGSAGNPAMKSGYGLLFTRRRIANLNKLYKDTLISFTLDLPEPGATARFIFNNWLD